MAPPRRVPLPANDNVTPRRLRLQQAAAVAVLVALIVAVAMLKFS